MTAGEIHPKKHCRSNRNRGAKIGDIMKEYKIAYGNSFKKFLSYLINAIFNFMFISLLAVILDVIVLYFAQPSTFYIIFTIIIFSISTATAFILSVKPKKVIVTDLAVLVKRNSIYVLNDLFSDCVLYSQIKSCDMYYDERIKFGWDGKKYAVRAFDWDCAVQIIDNRNKEYIIPIENPDDFIDDVTKRVNEYRRKNGLEEICF